MCSRTSGRFKATFDHSLIDHRSTLSKSSNAAGSSGFGFEIDPSGLERI
jgi:hypothetical protein